MSGLCQTAEDAGRAWYAQPASLLNRCNLSPRRIAERHFQEQPQQLALRGVREEHRGLWLALADIDDADERAALFHHYTISWQWLHEDPDLRPDAKTLDKRSYASLLRGWGYDSNGPSGAVLKWWAEHRFGLRPIFHGDSLTSNSDVLERDSLKRLHMGLNQVLVQLDLLYTFCQDELRRRPTPPFQQGVHLILYRGSHDPDAYVIKTIQQDDSDSYSLGRRHELVEFNCISSFTNNQEVAWEFGSRVWKVHVPLSKICYYSQLLPQAWLASENEFLVLGGDYTVQPLMG